jgi:glutamine amidotransferase class I
MVVMGGPQDVWQEDQYPWFREEKTAIRKFVLDMQRPYLGICLGYQSLADATGGHVGRAKSPEVGVRNRQWLRRAKAVHALQRNSPAPPGFPPSCYYPNLSNVVRTNPIRQERPRIFGFAETLALGTFRGRACADLYKALIKARLERAIFGYFLGRNGGEGGIRTLETVARLHAFQACAFDHSATSPWKKCRTIAERPRGSSKPRLRGSVHARLKQG